ncbi:hypothetical protein [Acrocarpospora catenulata]|uniref:hypothetical protein n=1 Tax=Acrocarpospora catenulata TaxID=2836182 RepID=UPI001BD943F8|nr:hypothetical protein [Acrocarpospora catenulata]
MTLPQSRMLAELTTANRPGQLDLLDHIVGLFAVSPAVTHLLVRGSLAYGTSDRLSDVDLVVGVQPSRFSAYAAVLDAVVRVELGAILPGWPDRIVPAMGGLGSVHLLEHQGHLQQLDLYLAPADRIPAIAGLARGVLVYSNSDAAPEQPNPAVEAFVRDRLAVAPSCHELLVEALVLASMLRKRLARRQRMMAYAEYHMLVTAVRSLIRTALQPSRAAYGWYHLDTEIGASSLGRACLDDLATLMDAPSVPTRETLARALEVVITVAHRVAPDTMDDLRLDLDAYLHHMT